MEHKNKYNMERSLTITVCWTNIFCQNTLQVEMFPIIQIWDTTQYVTVIEFIFYSQRLLWINRVFISLASNFLYNKPVRQQVVELPDT